MDCVCSYSKISLSQFRRFSSFNLQSSTLFKKNPLPLMVSCRNNHNNNDEKCMFNGLTAPLVPRTETGRLLSVFMQNDKALFNGFVEKELERLDCMKNDALLRSVFSVGTDEAILHRFVVLVSIRVLSYMH